MNNDEKLARIRAVISSLEVSANPSSEDYRGVGRTAVEKRVEAILDEKPFEVADLVTRRGRGPLRWRVVTAGQWASWLIPDAVAKEMGRYLKKEEAVLVKHTELERVKS